VGAAGHRQNHAGALDRNGAHAEFIALSAVQAGIKDIRAVVEQARSLRGSGHGAVPR
jgi:replication-associated recombination protein RarA